MITHDILKSNLRSLCGTIDTYLFDMVCVCMCMDADGVLRSHNTSCLHCFCLWRKNVEIILNGNPSSIPCLWTTHFHTTSAKSSSMRCLSMSRWWHRGSFNGHTMRTNKCCSFVPPTGQRLNTGLRGKASAGHGVLSAVAQCSWRLTRGWSSF